MSFDETFGARLRNCRLQEKLTQQELGDVVGLTKQAINDIEKGRRSTTISKAILLARYFNTTVEFLSGRTDNPSRGQGDYASFVEHLFGDVESSFSYRLRASRLSKNVTEKEVATAIEISELLYKRYENGTSFPELCILIYLADYFDVSLDYLVGRSDVKERR